VAIAVAPLLQLRRMLAQRSARDVSIGYFAVLVPGFALWIGYGAARSDWALVVPNSIALLVTTATIIAARRLHRGVGRSRSGGRR
jgi:uncharacterized protein with PQ loop repeat